MILLYLKVMSSRKSSNASTCLVLGRMFFSWCCPFFTNEEINTVMNILKEFGDEVTKYMIVLFTKEDDLEDIEDCLKEVHPNLKTIIQIYRQRYHVFNNRDNKNDHQVSSLLKKINEMVERNEGKCYTTAMYQKVKDRRSG
ncbi:GTPase IMAP family member 4 [Anabarilius grahami]|uniref:GTPase IMAP family member 4 n=1 Tax=Anabarilius grahami TaxID=495550 RepID=A0A3N0XDG9_ANAGA|nr:GTPase IMAP family member 4 [Anabarilius grahami]